VSITPLIDTGVNSNDVMFLYERRIIGQEGEK